MEDLAHKAVLHLEDLPYLVTAAGRKYKQARYLCHCGNEFVAIPSNVWAGITKSCGCLHNKAPRNFKNKR